MAHLNNSFASAAAGTLMVTFSADFWSSFVNSGGAFGRGTADFAVICMIKNQFGVVVARSIISTQTVYSTLILADYPGASSVWTIQTQTNSSVSGGNVGSWGAQNLRAVVRLAKR